jgi:hypothetical protein
MMCKLMKWVALHLSRLLLLNQWRRLGLHPWLHKPQQYPHPQLQL